MDPRVSGRTLPRAGSGRCRDAVLPGTTGVIGNVSIIGIPRTSGIIGKLGPRNEGFHQEKIKSAAKSNDRGRVENGGDGKAARACSPSALTGAGFISRRRVRANHPKGTLVK